MAGAMAPTSEVSEPPQSNNDDEQRNIQSHQTNRSGVERTFSNDGLDQHNSSTGDNDEYIKMLIRQELGIKIEEVELKLQQIASDISAQAIATGTSRAMGEEENPALEDLETKVDIHYRDIQA